MKAKLLTTLIATAGIAAALNAATIVANYTLADYNATDLWLDAGTTPLSHINRAPDATDTVIVRGSRVITLKAGDTGLSNILQVASTANNAGTLNVYGTLSSAIDSGTTVNSIGLNTGTNGVMNVYSGGSYTSNHIFTVGGTGTGTLNINGGLVTINSASNRAVRVAQGAGSTGTLNITNGGKLDNKTGGTLEIGNASAGSNGALRITDGTLSANRIHVYNGSAVVIGHNATLALRSTATASTTSAFTIGGKGTLKFELGATKDFSTVDFSTSTQAAYFAAGSMVVIDVSAFTQSFAEDTLTEITLIKFNTVGGNLPASVTITGLEDNIYLKDATASWNSNILTLSLFSADVPIPEPSAYAAVLGALALLALSLRRRKS